MQPIYLWKVFRNTVTGKKSRRIYDVISNPLTLDRKYVSRQMKNQATLFKEIGTVLYEHVLPPLYLKRLLELKPRTKRVSLPVFMDTFIQTLTSYIANVWRRDRFNVVLHSGGWDSRILSAVLSRINRGKNLGNILFLCYGEECRVLSKVMRIEGWTQRQYISIPWNDQYFRYNLNFKTAWRLLNGPSPYPVNNPLWGIAALRSLRRIPDYDKIMVWSAIYFNEVFTYLRGKNPVETFLNRYYYFWATNLISGFPFAFVEPILNYKTLKSIIEAKLVLPKDIRARIMRRINPELAGIPRKTNPTRLRIPKKYCVKIENEYARSWYGKKVRPNVKRDFRIVHSDWWSAWSSASLVEHLIQKGITIK